MSATPETVDGTAEEEGGMGVVHVPQQQPVTLFRTDDPVEVVERATRVANALKGVLVGQGMLAKISGKEYVTVEGWQTLGSMLGVTAVVTTTEVIEGGYKAHVEARTLDGRVIGAADAICTKQEKRGPWKSAEDYARLSMAQTRATSKALKGPLGFIVRLAGYSSTPAEEMTFAQEDEPQAPNPNADTSPEAATLDLKNEALCRDLGLRQEKADELILAARSLEDKRALKQRLEGIKAERTQA